jgi:integrase
VDPTDQTIVRDYARLTMATRPHSARTAARVESMIRNHLDNTPLGARRLAAVRPSEVQAWVTDRARVLKPSTLRLLVGLMRSVFAAAVLDRLVTTSPFVRIALPRGEQERIVPLTVDQVRALADAVAPQYRAMVVTQAGLGLRIGELLALRVVDVDFLRRTVRVEHQIDPKTRERIPPKTPRSRRTLPLPGVVAEALAQHIATFPPTADGLIFHTSTDRPHWQEHYGARVLARAVEHAGLPAGTTSHDLRHHYASVLLAAGESVVAVAERLGHEDATLVLTTYGHLMPDSEDRTRRAVDEAWNAVSGPPRKADTAHGRPR